MTPFPCPACTERPELEHQGRAAGEEPVWRALGCAIPRARVRRVLAELKAASRRRAARHAAGQRVTIEVLVRDGMRGLDATHLGRDAAGDEIPAEVLRQVASTRATGLSAGPPATAADVITLFDKAPSTSATLHRSCSSPTMARPTRASRSRSGAMARRHPCPASRSTIPARSMGMRELEEVGLPDRAVLLHDAHEAAARLGDARRTIDGCRLRRTRGWRTACAELPPDEAR